MLRSLAITLFTALAIATPAQAAVSPSMQANFDRAAAYWGDSPLCVDGVQVVVDQAFVAPNAARADMPGCHMYIGDYFATVTPGRQCAIVVHEWGHMTGHDHTVGLPDDPSGVMVSDAMPPACDALDAPLRDAAAAKTAADTAVWVAFDRTYVAWTTRSRARSYCTADANDLKRRAARVSARKRCVKRYGQIVHAPSGPSVPRPQNYAFTTD